jgi:ElaB/YqjD/DUF883 family membrane-anchored ribosome-binding protein
METIMDDKKPDPKTIAEEAVGERGENPTTDAAQPEMPTEEVIRQLARSAGPQADIAAQTAEAVGERVGDAYATTDEVKAGSRKVTRIAASQASWAAQQPFMTVAAGFALGYAAALLIHRRQ